MKERGWSNEENPVSCVIISQSMRFFFIQLKETEVIKLYFCSPVVQIPGAEKNSTLTVTVRVYRMERFTLVQIKGTLITHRRYIKKKKRFKVVHTSFGK